VLPWPSPGLIELMKQETNLAWHLLVPNYVDILAPAKSGDE